MGMRISFLLAVVSLVSGCATITSTEMQTLSLRTTSIDDQEVEQVKCGLHNDKGAWEIVTPGYVSVHRSSDDLLVECKKEGLNDGNLRAISRAAGGMFGNIVFGGAIGALIDHSKGTGYNYPTLLRVKMGATTIADRRDESKLQQQAAEQQVADRGTPKTN